ncbi:MAG: hypothetical protein IIC41_06820 [Candidatus Marinimicrobia bacterium]|nr:hypothetical protein [Candidatus Neomarinimicrobiota bacterium]
MSKQNTVGLVLAGLLIVGGLGGQNPPPPTLVTIPTAGTLQRGEYEVEILMQTGGGILGRLGVGFSDRFSLGMSYGVNQFIGNAKPSLNRLMPEAQLKYRFLDETYSLPAMALGVDTQGRGKFWEAEIDTTPTGEPRIKMARYDVKAIGVYLVVSKNWQLLGNFGSHFGVSKNFLEEDETDKDFNFFLGFDKEFSPSILAFLEYNAAIDDNESDDDVKNLINFQGAVGQGRGYLSAGVRFTVSPNLHLEIDFKDIILNNGQVDFFSRELKIVYMDLF